jgi:act minimal PKS acyl carrier protein
MSLDTKSLDRVELIRLLQESAGLEEGVALDAGADDTPLCELGYDSLALLQVTGRIRREYGVELPEVAVSDMEPFGGWIDLILETVSAGH